MRDLCLWTIGDGAYGHMAQSLVTSLRAVHVTDDIHVFSDRGIKGAFSHRASGFEKRHFLFKFHFLKEQVKNLEYRYFAFLDADNYAVRELPPLLDFMHGGPLHAFLESDCTNPAALRPDWWGCPLPRFVQLMREAGVLSQSVYNVNAGFWIVERAAVDEVFRLVFEFWERCRAHGYTFTEEAPLAYAVHMLARDPDQHLMRHHFDTWSCDWIGNFRNRLPTGEPWIFRDYLSGQDHLVNPALVHAMRSKDALVALGRR